MPVFAQSDDEAAAGVAKTYPNLVNVGVGLSTNHRFGRVVPLWNSMRRLINMEDSAFVPAATLFLGELKTPAGSRRLVEVHLTLHFSNSTNLALVTQVVKPAGILSAASPVEQVYGLEPSMALRRSTEPSVGVNAVAKWENAAKLYIYAGCAKESDPSSFEARVVMELLEDGGFVEERIIGRLMDDDTVQLQATNVHIAEIFKALGE